MLAFPAEIGLVSWKDIGYSRRMEPTEFINAQIEAVASLVNSFNTKVDDAEIQDLSDAKAFLNAWLAGMRSLQQ
jgi:hypothetical protein